MKIEKHQMSTKREEKMKGNTVDTKTITWTIYQANNGLSK